MSRPTNESKYVQADRWMKEAFGNGMQDYLREQRETPQSVAVVEIAKVLRKAGTLTLLEQWRAADIKSPAGIRAFISPHSALALILLQLRLRRNTLVTEIGDTYLRLSTTQRAILGMHHDGHDDRVYDRVWSAVQRLIGLVDEFPGRRDKVLNGAEFRAMIEARDPVDAAMRRERMFTLANSLLEGSRLLLPQEILDRTDGNAALDATFIPMYGKAGNRSPKILDGARHSANPEAGWYTRDGSHGAVTHADAKHLNEAEGQTGKKQKGVSNSKIHWGVEAEIVRMTPNLNEGAGFFPLLTNGLSFHVPGEIKGEALRLADSLLERGHRANLWIVDRAYSNGIYMEYSVPLRLRGFKLVHSYKDNELGVQAFDPRGFVQISGAWYLDTVSTIHRTMDATFLAAENKFKAAQRKLQSDLTIGSPTEDPRYSAARKEYVAARDLYRRQFAERSKFMLKPKGQMESDGSRRYLIPTASRGYAKWRQNAKSHPGATVTMKLPVGKEAIAANAGGLKHEQYFPWGSESWRAANGMRNGVESVNRNVKRSQYEDIANAELRAVRGNTFTYIVIALATVVENLRKIISFFKEQLAVKPLTPKVSRLPGTFYQAPDATQLVSLC